MRAQRRFYPPPDPSISADALPAAGCRQLSGTSACSSGAGPWFRLPRTPVRQPQLLIISSRGSGKVPLKSNLTDSLRDQLIITAVSACPSPRRGEENDPGGSGGAEGPRSRSCVYLGY